MPPASRPHERDESSLDPDLHATYAALLDAVGDSVIVTDLEGRILTALVPGLRVLFVSGLAGDEVERLGLLEAGRPFLSKPFSPELLVERVRELLVGRPVSL